MQQPQSVVGAVVRGSQCIVMGLSFGGMVREGFLEELALYEGLKEKWELARGKLGEERDRVI